MFLSWLAATAVLSACGRDPIALLAPAVKRSNSESSLTPQNVLNVLDYGAVGDGKTDDTRAFKKAIAALAPAGGILLVPPGVFMIDPTRSIRLISNVTLALAGTAILKAIPTVAAYSDVIVIRDVTNVCVTGGTIFGERDGHLGSGGETGMGISVYGSSQVSIVGVTAKNCWGDGFYIGRGRAQVEARQVTISKCKSENNRRQGLSITGCIGALIEDSSFTDTNGTEPQAGIDLEPNRDMHVTDITIRNCEALRNAGAGIQLVGNWRGLGVVTNSRIEANLCSENGRTGIWLCRETQNCSVNGNRVTQNGTTGILIEQSSHNEITANVFRNNSRAPETYCPAVRLIAQSSHNLLKENSFGPKTLRGTPSPVPNIVMDEGCLDNIVIPKGEGASPKAPSGGKGECLPHSRACRPTSIAPVRPYRLLP